MFSTILLALAMPDAAANDGHVPNPQPTTPMVRDDCRVAIAYSAAHKGVSLLVLRDGKPVCEAYQDGDADTPHELWSGTKSMVGLMAAAAVQDGLLALDEPVATTIGEWRDDPERRGITIRHLLSMTSGQQGTIGRPPGYADALAAPLTAAPGERFQYSPTSLQIFGEVMRRKLIARGLPGDPARWFQGRVLTPAGIAVAAWRSGPDGNPLMPQGVAMTARQWARLGELVRAGGRVKGRALVDPAAFAALFQGSAANPAYGLTWWLTRATPAKDVVTAASDIPAAADRLPRDLVYAAGAGDQRLYVIPSQRMVIVRQATLEIGARSGWSDVAFLDLLLDPVPGPSIRR